MTRYLVTDSKLAKEKLQETNPYGFSIPTNFITTKHNAFQVDLLAPEKGLIQTSSNSIVSTSLSANRSSKCYLATRV